jgi:pimeloyl-ACP methyl ester carboxylesterase
MKTELRLNIVEHDGDGPACLIVHGALGSRSYWNENLAALATVCRPIVVELWGHGQSPSPVGDDLYTIESYVEQFDAIRHDLDVERWFTIGQSMGASLVLNYGLVHPDRVIAQIVTNSSSSFADPEEWRQRNNEMVRPTLANKVRDEGIAAVRDTWVNPSRSKRIPEATRSIMVEEFEEHDPKGLFGSFAITNRDLALGEKVLDVSRPTLLTLGVQEERFLPLVAQARRIPDIEVVDIEAAHAVNAQNASQWNEAAVAFLSRHRPT